VACGLSSAELEETMRASQRLGKSSANLRAMTPRNGFYELFGITSLFPKLMLGISFALTTSGTEKASFSFVAMVTANIAPVDGDSGLMQSSLFFVTLRGKRWYNNERCCAYKENI